MDAQLIEKLDRRRYKTLLWQAVGFASMFVGLIAKPYVTGKAAVYAICFTSGLGIGVFLAASFKSSRNERTIKSDPELLDALNNELIRLYGYKSLMWAFYATLITAATLLFISHRLDITARFACIVIIYAACLSLMISRLVYLRK